MEAGSSQEGHFANGDNGGEALSGSRRFAHTGRHPAFQEGEDAKPDGDDASPISGLCTEGGKPLHLKHLKLKKREELPEMDAEGKMHILGELRDFLKKEGHDVNKPLKSVIESLVHVAIAKYHLLPDEFITLVGHLNPEEIFETDPKSDHTSAKKDAWKYTGLAGPLLESFFLKMQQGARGSRRPSQVEQQEILTGFMEFVEEIGTRHEQRRIQEVVEDLQGKHAELDIVGMIIEDSGIMDILVKKITEEMVYRATQRFRDQYKQDQTVLDFLFSRVLAAGKDNEKIGTQEKSRRELVFYLESIGYRLEHLMIILARQPEFTQRERAQRVRRVMRMNVQRAMNEPQFGIEDDANSFHTWFFDHFATDIAKSRRKDHPGDLASLKRVTFESMARVMEPDMKRGPIQRLADEMNGNMERFYKSLDLHGIPETQTAEILRQEIDLGFKVIKEIERQALGLEAGSKENSVLLPILAGERDITKIFMAFNDPKGFLELNADFHPDGIVKKYNLKEYAKNEEHLWRLMLRIVRYEARLMLQFWWRARMYIPELQNLEEDHALIEKNFIGKYVIEAKPVRVRWRVHEEAEVEDSGKLSPNWTQMEDEKVPSYGCTIVGVEELESVPENKEKPQPLEKTEYIDTDTGNGQLRYPEEVFYGTKVTLDCNGRALTVIFYTPEGCIIDKKSIVSRIISKLRQGEKEPTDAYRTSMIVEGGAEELALARHFFFNVLSGDTAKLEDRTTGRVVRSEEKKRPSAASRLLASKREAMIAVQPMIRGEGGKIIKPTIEFTLFTLPEFCTYYQSAYTVTSTAQYHAARARQLYTEVLRPATVYPDELTGNFESAG